MGNIPVLTGYSTGDREFKNYFLGREAQTITKAADCTIVRGSTLVAEANKGYALGTDMAADVTLLTNDLPNGACFPNPTKKAATMSFWGGNSPLNLNQASAASGIFELGYHQYTGFSRPIYNLTGLKELGTGSVLHVATPLDCLSNDLLQQPFKRDESDLFHTKWYYWPEEKGAKQEFSCITQHVFGGNPGDYFALTKTTPGSCIVNTIRLDGQTVTL